jgi:peptidyl-prolyl cis-trans isomerase C
MGAALGILALVGCGGSHKDAGVAPSPAPTTAPSAASSGEGTALPATPPQPSAAQPQAARPVKPGTAAQGTVATVNGTPIQAERVASVYRMNKSMLEQRGRTLSDADDQALKAQSLEAVLADELLYQAAVAKGATVAASDVDTALKELKQRAGSEATYTKFLADSGLTEAGVRKELERNLKTEAFRKALVAGKGVTDAQAKQYYDANASKGMFNVPERVHLQYILVKASDKDPESVRVDAKKRADEAARKAASGEDFAALAKQYSQDPTAPRGGDIGLLPRGVMFPKFEEVAFSLKPGQVSPVFETPKGFNVVKLLEKLPVSTQSFDEVKAELMLEMGRMMEQDVVRAKVQELAAAAKIAILDSSFTKPAPTGAVAAKP